MTKFEHLVRSSISLAGGPGFLERSGCVIGISHMPPKQFHLRRLEANNAVGEVSIPGKEKWEFFIGMPTNQGGAMGLQQIAREALIREGLIRPECIKLLRQLPSSDFFTRIS
jgi:hypothetical protein